VPVPQATAAAAGAAGIIRMAHTANDLKMNGRVMGAARTFSRNERRDDRAGMRNNIGNNRGQNKALVQNRLCRENG
jgi:hypothetical protein